MRPDLLLLDVGGVLLQPAEPVDATYLRMGRPHGVEQVDFRRAFAQVSGRQLMDGRPYWRAVVREATGCADPTYFEALYQHYAQPQAWRVAPGALPLIDTLRAQGTPVALVSNWDTRLRGTLRAMGLLDRVDALFVSGELGVEKPDPRIFHLACRRFGVPPSRALMVGDSWSKDVHGAIFAGVPGLHFGAQVSDFRDLARWLERPPWHADAVLTLPQARAVAAGIPELADQPVAPLGQGWDSTVYSVGAQAVLRAPRRPLGAVSLHTELQVLRALDLPGVPKLLRVTSPVEGFPYAVACFERVGGVSLERWEGPDRRLLAHSLGEFLRALHGQVDARAGPDTLGRLEPQRLQRSIHQRGQAAVDDGWLSQPPVAPPVESVEHATALVHGDLYARHIHVDAAGALVGLVDWGDVHLGHPAVDLAGVLGVLPPTLRSVFLDAYGSVSPGTLALARLRGMHHQLGVLAYAMDIGDRPLAHTARLALGWLGEATTSE
ncbi:MAG: HAD-IA family hydrolase [Myxococcota bacterium]|nr:HAD-IA family hydrolase [Myxococcota bacterium]